MKFNWFHPLACIRTLLFFVGFTTLCTADKPNIVLIVADDLGWGDVGFHGSQYYTPNLDRMALEGIQLDQHYVAPVCSPTRSALMTGRYWSRFGCTTPTNDRVLAFDTVTLAVAMKAAGYDTAITAWSCWAS